MANLGSICPPHLTNWASWSSHATLGRIATLLLTRGDQSEAQTLLQKILAQDPSNHGAIEQLAGFASLENLEDLDSLASAAQETAPRKTMQRANLLFARGHLARRKQDSEAAEEFYRQGNKETASLSNYHPKKEEELNRAITAGFADLPKEVPEVSSPPTPLYVIGLPRSGTTLTEAILAAHPQIAALRERNVDEALASGFLHGRSFGAEDCARLARVTNENLPDLPADTSAFVDKMPENHRFIGFLVAARPDAKVIHLKRDPRDIALSQWPVLFGDGALSYTYDFKAMAHRFNLYAQMMQFWHDALPGRILDVQYEDLVSNIDAGSKLLSIHCGLDWVPAMANHQASVGTVRTASQHQVRQPVHTRSVGKWQGKEELLEPFVKALDPDLWPEIRDK